jgi:hypothetical protein
MITGFEVGAIFRLQDEFSATLRRMAEEVRAFNVLVKEAKTEIVGLGRIRFPGLNAEMKALKDQAADIGKVFGAAFTSIDTGASTAQKETASLAAEWRTVTKEVQAAGAAMRGINLGAASAMAGPGINPRQRIAGAHGGGGGGGLHVSSFGIPTPGGHAYLRGGGNAAMVGGGALAYGLYEQAQLEDATFQMLWHAAMPPTDANKAKFRELIQSTASQTGFSYHDIAEAATNEIRLMKGAPGAGIDILPEMLRAAATESRLKGTGLKESMATLVEMAHMTKEYSPEEIKALAPVFGFLSTANPATLPQMGRAASYAMPTLQSALHMDPADVLYETTAIARAGATNTKSGTWVRSAFERALPPDPRLVGKKTYEARMLAMRSLGLVDEAGKSTVLDPTGDHLDIDKFLNTVRQKADTLSTVDRNNFVKAVFGEQGARGVDLMMSPQVLAQTQELKREFPEFKSRYSTFMEDYSAQSPVQKARQTWEDLTNVLSDIGTIALPPVIAGLRVLDSTLKGVAAVLPKGGPSHLSTGIAAGAATGAGAGFFAGQPTVGALTGGVVGALDATKPNLSGGLTGAVTNAINLGRYFLSAKTNVEGTNKAFEATDRDAAAASKSVTDLNSSLFSLSGIAASIKSFFQGIAPPASAPPPAVLEKQSFIPGINRGATPGLMPASFQSADTSEGARPIRVPVPPTRSQIVVNVPLNIDLDGNTFAQVINTKLAELMEFPTQAPFWNGKGGYESPDFQNIST